jgi:hypothetical protein
MMRAGSLRFLAFALTIGMTGVAAAHHPPKVERCENLTFSGQIERINWRRPHVEIFVRTEEGVTYELGWLAINRLGLANIEKDTLHPGDRVTIRAGIRPNEVVSRPMLLNFIHRESDGWEWSQAPEGC